MILWIVVQRYEKTWFYSQKTLYLFSVVMDLHSPTVNYKDLQSAVFCGFQIPRMDDIKKAASVCRCRLSYYILYRMMTECFLFHHHFLCLSVAHFHDIHAFRYRFAIESFAVEGVPFCGGVCFCIYVLNGSRCLISQISRV